MKLGVTLLACPRATGMLFLLSRLRLVLRKVMGQHREHVHTVQHSCQSRILPTGYKGTVSGFFLFLAPSTDHSPRTPPRGTLASTGETERETRTRDMGYLGRAAEPDPERRSRPPETPRPSAATRDGTRGFVSWIVLTRHTATQTNAQRPQNPLPPHGDSIPDLLSSKHV